MNITITIPTDAEGKLVLPVRKIDSDHKIDLAKVPADMLARVFMYGAVQITNDCHASIKVAEGMSDDELLAAHGQVEGLIGKRWDAIMSGEWRVRGPAAESADPVTREATRLAREDVRKAVVKRKELNKHAPSWKEIEDEKKDAATAKQLAANEAGYRKQAEAILAARKAASSAVDLGDLI